MLAFGETIDGPAIKRVAKSKLTLNVLKATEEKVSMEMGMSMELMDDTFEDGDVVELWMCTKPKD